MMKNTGMTRKVDNLGRVVIPIELRRTMGIDVKDPLELYVEGRKIIYKKFVRGCIFCGELDNTFEQHGKEVCPKCASEAKELVS